ncbi:hypothetical protein A2U01_0098650, partial [Trifolium medium]|nr:hypothetical protein [Trifolium medium]
IKRIKAKGAAEAAFSGIEQLA